MTAIYLIIEPVPIFQSLDGRIIRTKERELIQLSGEEGKILVDNGNARFIKPVDPQRKRRSIP